MTENELFCQVYIKWGKILAETVLLCLSSLRSLKEKELDHTTKEEDDFFFFQMSNGDYEGKGER